MVKYLAYNKLYINGKSVGRSYIIATGSTKEEVTKKANIFNNTWNKLKMNKSKGYKALLYEVKKK